MDKVKTAIIVIVVIVAVTVLELIWFIGRGIPHGINQSHNWEENPDKAESEGEHEKK